MKKLALAATLASVLTASASAQQVTFVEQVLPERFRDNVQIVTEVYAQVQDGKNTSRKNLRAHDGLEEYVVRTSRPAVEREMRKQFPADLPEGKYFFVLDQPEVVAVSERYGVGRCAWQSAGIGTAAGVGLGFLIVPQSEEPQDAAKEEVRNGVIGGSMVGLAALTYCLTTQTGIYVRYDVSQSGILYRVTE